MEARRRWSTKPFQRYRPLFPYASETWWQLNFNPLPRFVPAAMNAFPYVGNFLATKLLPLKSFFDLRHTFFNNLSYLCPDKQVGQ